MPAFVVSWDAGRRSVFVVTDDWATARSYFEQKAEELFPDFEPGATARRYGELSRVGGRVDTRGTAGLAITRAHRADDTAGAEVFIEMRVRNHSVPVVGSRRGVDRAIARAGDRVSVRTFEPFVDEARTDRFPSEMTPTLPAQLALERLLRERVAVQEGIRGLARGEILWMGTEARRREAPALALRVADHLLRHETTVAAVNLKGGAQRHLGMLTASAATFRTSIDGCSSAAANPMARVGIAATLRRMDQLDEAYDHVKLARRHFPDNKYVLELLDALGRDRAGVRRRDAA